MVLIRASLASFAALAALVASVVVIMLLQQAQTTAGGFRWPSASDFYDAHQSHQLSGSLESGAGVLSQTPVDSSPVVADKSISISQTQTPDCTGVPSPGTKACVGWGCRFSAGIFSDGPPFLRFKHVCVGSNMLVFVPQSPAEEASLRGLLGQCCNRTDISPPVPVPPASQRPAPTCLGTQDARTLCYHAAMIYDSFVTLERWNETVVAEPQRYWYPGKSYYLDTAVTSWHQFGHSMRRFVQFGLLEEVFDRIVMPRVDHLPGDGRHVVREGLMARAIFNATVLPHIQVEPESSTGATLHLGGPGATPVCVEDLFFVPDYEKMHFSRLQGERWRKIAEAYFNVPRDPCPPPRVALLKRMAGDGSTRGFSNEHVIDEVAAEFGIHDVERVSIGARNSTMEQAALFSSIGLLFSGHSSQLTNLLFSPRHIAVVEIIGSFIPYWLESPFQMGVKNFDVHYNLSRYHWGNTSACGEECVAHGTILDKNSMLTIDRGRLRASLHQVIAEQLRACPSLPWILPKYATQPPNTHKI